MKKLILKYRSFPVLFALIFTGSAVMAQDTFSITAVDSITGEIGSAGASCVGSTASYPHGAQILSDVIPGIGAIHTQASWNSINQQNAHAHMIAGESPQQIIDWLITHDANSNPAIRQYGIVDYNNGHPRSAAYTGINCLNYKNDTAGLAYSIQGNILSGQEILDSMQTRFLNTPGTLAERLMAALQGAKIIGADTRCASPFHSSSLSAFIRVAKPTDPDDSLFLDLWMSYPQNFTGAVPVDPIDSLQTLFDIWQLSLPVKGNVFNQKDLVRIFFDTSGNTVFDFSGYKEYTRMQLLIFDCAGRLVENIKIIDNQTRLDGNKYSKGFYLYQVLRNDRSLVSRGKFLISK